MTPPTSTPEPAYQSLRLFSVNHRPYRRLGAPGTQLGVGPRSTIRPNDQSKPSLSHLNGSINEATGIYWVWKHLEQLGNPDFVGICHYRRFFNLSLPESGRARYLSSLFWRWQVSSEQALLEKLRQEKAHGLTAIPLPFAPETICEQFNQHLGHAELLRQAIQLLSEHCPEYQQDFNDYLNATNFFPYNMFIVNREDFCAMCEASFPTILQMLEIVNQLPENVRPTNPRFVGHIYERLSGAYWFALMRHGRHFIECPILHCTSYTDWFVKWKKHPLAIAKQILRLRKELPEA